MRDVVLSILASVVVVVSATLLWVAIGRRL